MKFISNHIFKIVLIVIVVIGILLVALGGYLQPILGAVSTPFVEIQRWVSSRYLAISEILTMPRDTILLRQENQELKNQVSQLQSQVIQLQEQLGEAQVLYALLDFARERPENKYIAGSIIGKDPSPFLQYVIIDHGSDDGLKKGMPVVTEQGLVGQVAAVTAKAARVQLISDSGSVVNVRLKNAAIEAQLKGSISGENTLEMIPQDAQLEIGDIVLTSGLGGTYPPGIVIGQVTQTRKVETDLFQTAVVQPIVNFAQLKAVLIIINFEPIETSPLFPTE